jgi:O-antigen ligase
MTGSRYGLLNTGLALVVIFLLSVSIKRRSGALLTLFLVLLPTFGWITISVANRNRATRDRFQTLRNPLDTDSFRGRFDDLWRDAAKEFVESPIFGHGPAKAMFSDIVTDSEYLDVLKEFGLIGFFAYLAYYIYPFRRLWRGLKHAGRSDPVLDIQRPAGLWVLRFSFIMLITALVMNIGMSTFYNQPLQGFFWLWMGIGVSAARSDSQIDQLQAR